MITALMPFLLLASGDASLRCAGRLVERGMNRISVESRCGAPDHTMLIPMRIELDQFSRDGLTTELREMVEIWTYAGKPGRLLRQLELRQGQVVAIRTLERLDESDTAACKRGVFPVGQSAGVIALSCGAPLQRDRWSEVREGPSSRRLVSLEKWVYRPAPGRLLRVLYFEDGVLRSVEIAERLPRSDVR